MAMTPGPGPGTDPRVHVREPRGACRTRCFINANSVPHSARDKSCSQRWLISRHRPEAQFLGKRGEKTRGEIYSFSDALTISGVYRRREVGSCRSRDDRAPRKQFIFATVSALGRSTGKRKKPRADSRVGRSGHWPLPFDLAGRQTSIIFFTDALSLRGVARRRNFPAVYARSRTNIGITWEESVEPIDPRESRQPRPSALFSREMTLER